MQSRCRTAALLLGCALGALPSLGVAQDAPEAEDAAPEAPTPAADAEGPADAPADPPRPPQAGDQAGPADAAAQGGQGDQAGASEVAMEPPRVLTSVPPVYPASHLTHGEHPTVVLKATIMADGTVADVHVEHTAGEDFDRAAIEAVRKWTFEPARRGGEPIASRVGIAVHFELPELSTFHVASVTDAGPMVPHRHGEGAVEHADEGEFEARATVRANLRAEARGPNDFRLDRTLLQAAPRRDAADLLAVAPGLVVARVEGDAVGHRLMLRGFDADHGQDIELSVDGVPINQPSHLHGQGYADLGFLIPETVRSVRVTEGVYDPAQGDFAVAGSADFQLGVPERGIHLASSYGAFNTFRELALWAPEGQSEDTFAAVLFRKTRGFGQNRAATSGTAVAQGTFGKGPLKLTLHGSAHAARALTANVVRRDDVRAGRVGFYDVYPEPTAESQNASTTRAQLGAKLRYLGERGENAELSLFYVFNDFRLLANYTGFTQTSRLNPELAGLGDLIEQMNETRTLGARARYRSASYAPSSWARGSLELGLAARVDRIAQAQNLLEAPDNTTWDRRVDADITAADIGGYFDLNLSLTRYVRLNGGVRADVLSYRIGDALQNFVPAYRSERNIAGYRRSAAGIAVGPRVVLEVEPVSKLVLSAAYGEGYRSPQALLLDEGEPAPFTKVRSGDVGARIRWGEHDAFSLRGSGYLTHLGDDLVFEADEGRAEAVGPTRRLGFVLHGDVRPFPWWLVAGSVTYVHATLLEPPPSSAHDPNPPLSRGDLLPYVPPWVLRVDTHVEHALFEFRGAPVVGRGGVGFTYWARRPLPYSQRAAPVSLVDLSLRATYRVLSLDATVFNLLDARYAANELSYASNWDPAAVPSRLPARHIQAGAPRTWLLTLGITL